MIRISTAAARPVPWLAAALLLLAAPELAAEGSRWSLEGKLGQAQLDGRFDTGVVQRVDDRRSSASLTLGYDLHRYLGIQAGYHDLGSYLGDPGRCGEDVVCITIDPLPVVPPARLDVTGFSVALTPQYPVNDRFTVYGKLGVIDWEADASSLPGEPPPLFQPADRDLLRGLGVRYAVHRGLGVLAEVEDLGFDAVTTSFGASWRF